MNTNKRLQQRRKRHYHLRRKVNGTDDRPRLAVFRSNSAIYAQLIDDQSGVTRVSFSSISKDAPKGIKDLKGVELARAVGKELAQRATAAGIEQVVFDRGGFKYHGQVKALAEGAREGGLQF